MKKNSGFTLVEVMLALSIAVLVSASLLAMVMMAKRTWAEGSAMIGLQSNGRLLLNQIARGSHGQYGLREANYNTLTIEDEGRSIRFSVDKNEPLTYSEDDDTTCRFYLQNERIWFDPDTAIGFDEYQLISKGRVEDINFSTIDHYVNVQLTMKDYASPRTDAFVKLTTNVFLRKARETLQ